MSYMKCVLLMFQSFELMKDYVSGVIEHSGKMVILMEIIEQCVLLHEKLLIFRSLCNIIAIIFDFQNKINNKLIIVTCCIMQCCLVVCYQI